MIASVTQKPSDLAGPVAMVNMEPSFRSVRADRASAVLCLRQRQIVFWTQAKFTLHMVFQVAFRRFAIGRFLSCIYKLAAGLHALLIRDGIVRFFASILPTIGSEMRFIGYRPFSVARYFTLFISGVIGSIVIPTGLAASALVESDKWLLAARTK